MAEAQDITLESIISKYQLNREDLDAEFSRKDMLSIAVKITDWRVIGRYLGIPKEKLTSINIDSRTEDERRIVLLETWKERESSRATYTRLMDTLHQRGRNDLVEEICKLIAARILSESG